MTEGREEDKGRKEDEGRKEGRRRKEDEGRKMKMSLLTGYFLLEHLLKIVCTEVS
jgi:hypothetical protein